MKNRMNMKVSNIGHRRRIVCKWCNGQYDTGSGSCMNDKCDKDYPVVQIFAQTNKGENIWEDEEFVCHGMIMEVTGLADCNGWKCGVCGHEVPDIASMKMETDSRGKNELR